jgi:hypothetical protein
VGFFDGRAPGGKNAVWKLTVDFEMPSDGAEVELKRVDMHCQHCILGAVPAGKNPHCSMTFTDSIGDPDHTVKGSSTYLHNVEARAAEDRRRRRHRRCCSPRLVVAGTSHRSTCRR